MHRPSHCNRGSTHHLLDSRRGDASSLHIVIDRLPTLGKQEDVVTHRPSHCNRGLSHSSTFGQQEGVTHRFSNCNRGPTYHLLDSRIV